MGAGYSKLTMDLDAWMNALAVREAGFVPMAALVQKTVAVSWEPIAATAALGSCRHRRRRGIQARCVTTRANMPMVVSVMMAVTAPSIISARLEPIAPTVGVGILRRAGNLLE